MAAPEGQPAGGDGADLEADELAAFERAVFGARARLTPREMAERLGLPVEVVTGAWHTAGMPAVGPDERVLAEGDEAIFGSFAAASELFGRPAVEQFARVARLSLAKIADAAFALARTQLHGPQRDAHAPPEVRAQAITEANLAFEAVTELLAPLLRHQALIELRRAEAARAGFGPGVHDRLHLAVAFVDLVGSTELYGHTDLTVLAQAVGRFEGAAVDRASHRSGRVIKQIGDEVMLAANDPADGCRLALDLRAFVRDDGVLTDTRGAVAFGEVVTQAGDVYGPTVNLAARSTAVAEPGQVLVTAAVRAACAGSDDLVFRPAGEHGLRGIDEPTELFEVDWS